MRVGQPKLSERKSQKSGLFVPPTNVHYAKALHANEYEYKHVSKRQEHDDPAFLYNLITQASLDDGRAFLSYRGNSPNPRWPDTHNIA
jgi:hypothetical protein